MDIGAKEAVLGNALMSMISGNIHFLKKRLRTVHGITHIWMIQNPKCHNLKDIVSFGILVCRRVAYFLSLSRRFVGLASSCFVEI